jgi:hypothetical protein
MKLFIYLLQQTKVNGWVWLLQTKKIGEFVSYELQQNRWVSILQAKNNVRLFSGKAHKNIHCNGKTKTINQKHNDGQQTLQGK